MLAINCESDYYKKEMNKAIYCLKIYDYISAKKHIQNIIIKDFSKPEGHNLLGIMYELQGNLNLARRHYRASYSLDPTFKAASKNLERISNFFYNSEDIDYGDKINLNYKTSYNLVYDKNNIGRLVKV